MEVTMGKNNTQKQSFSNSDLKKRKEILFRKSLNRQANNKGCSCRNGGKK